MFQIVLGRLTEMKIILVFTRRSGREGFQLREIGQTIRKIIGVLIRDFIVPQIGFLGPGSQPEQFLGE